MTRPVFEFGPYRLDPSERLLLRAGNSVPVTPKALELLLVLVEHRGRVVAKDELMKLVWSETFVEETNLTHHISVLRGALGEQCGPFIETVPRRGYRFVAAVTERFEDQPDDAGANNQAGNSGDLHDRTARPQFQFLRRHQIIMVVVFGRQRHSAKAGERECRQECEVLSGSYHTG